MSLSHKRSRTGWQPVGVAEQRNRAAANRRRRLAIALSISLFALPQTLPLANTATSTLEVQIHETGRDTPLPCRVHLTAGDQVIYAPGCPSWPRDAGFCCDGRFRVAMPAGPAQLRIERGPEWLTYNQTLTIPPGTTHTLRVELSRWIDMNSRGWVSGDLHVHRPPADMPLLLCAEDLNVAPVLTHWNNRHTDQPPPYLRDVLDQSEASPRRRFYHLLNQEDERFGGAILIFNLRQPIFLDNVYYYWPSGLAFHRAALEQDAHVELEKPFWWEAPVHVALGRIASIGIVHNHFNRRGLMDNEAWGRPREPDRYSGQLGFCLYSLDLYYRYLNLGWDIPVSAGSASGVLANPLGYCRTYVQTDRLDYSGWFDALRAGRNFATNGPMLFVTVNNQPAGSRFAVEAGKPFEATVRLEVLCRDPLDRAEVIVGGKTASTFRPQPDNPKRIAADCPLSLDRSTWIAVRAFERHEPTPRFAHTSPFYVAVGGQKRHDPDAARFFVQWIDDLIDRLEKDREKLQNAEHFDELIKTYRQARAVYSDLAKAAQGPQPNEK